MTNCYIVSTIWNPEKGIEKMVTDAIKKASGSPYTHTQTVFVDKDGNETMYESTHPDGFKKTVNYIYPGDSSTKKRQPLYRDISEQEYGAGVAWWENKISQKTKYAHLKLIVYTLLYRTKKLWDKLNFYPFSCDKAWGEFCSAACVNNLKFMSKLPGSMDLDLFPGESGEAKTPGDIDKKLEENK